MSYIGRGVDAISNVEKLDNITFNGGTTYALTKSSAAFTPVGANNILISIDGVIQQGNFSVSTTNIVFDFSPTSSNTCDFVLHYGTGVLNVPADGSVTAAKMAANSVDSDSYVDGSIDAAHLSANSVDSDAYVDGSIDLAHMSSESVDEDNLHISNAGSNGQFLSKQSGNAGGLTWASAGGDLSFGGDTFGADKVIGANDAYAMSFETSGNVAMKIDANGHITKPLQPSFIAFMNANQTFSNGAWTTTAFNSEGWDTNADFNTSTHTFTAPVTGKYLSTMMVRVDAIATGDGEIHFVLDASNRDFYYSHNTIGSHFDGTSSFDSGTFNYSGIIDMDANDTAKFIHYMSNARTITNNSTRTWWSMQLLG